MNNRLNRVVFFSKEDLASNHMLKNAEKLLTELSELHTLTLNDLLELYHVKKYFDQQLFLQTWNEQTKQNHIETTGKALTETRLRYQSLGQENLADTIATLEFDNQEEFWELFRYFETYKRIEKTFFSTLLSRFPNQLRHILPLKQVVLHFDKEIRDFITCYEESAELLLTQFEQDRSIHTTKYIFPKSLSAEDKETILSNYLDTDDPNLNYVNLIRNSKQLKLSPQTLLKAKKTAEKITEKYLTDENSFKISVDLTLDKLQVTPLKEEIKYGALLRTYGGKYFDSLNPITLFKVFHHTFGFIDKEGLIALQNKVSEMDGFERAFMKSKNEYETGFVFSEKDLLSMAQVQLMEGYLRASDRTLNALLQDFVDDQFKNNFKLDKLVFKMPQASNDYSDMIRLTAPELDYLMKQYGALTSEGAIDHELLQIDSTPIFLSDISSLVKIKYVYAEKDNSLINELQYYFFSQVGPFYGVKSWQKRYHSFFGLLDNEDVYKNDFEDFQIDLINHLVKRDILIIDQQSKITIKNNLQLYLIGRLHKNDYLNYWHYDDILRAEIDQMLAVDLLKPTNTLFTRTEISYLNYYLNKKEFTDGHDLRNKYLHGSNPRSKNESYRDYLLFIRLAILILLKLEDDISMMIKSLPYQNKA